MSDISAFVIDGHEYYFSAISGTVVSTESRSDTHVRGSGSVNTYQGTGGGSTRISSNVVITRDIWVVDDQGKEMNWRYNSDIPVRQGHRIHSITPYRDKVQYPEMYLYNSSTDQLWTFHHEQDLMNQENPLAKLLRWGFNAGVLYLLGAITLMALFGDHYCGSKPWTECNPPTWVAIITIPILLVYFWPNKKKVKNAEKFVVERNKFLDILKTNKA